MTTILSVIFEAKPGKEKALQDLATGLLAPSRKEPGCIRYDLHRSKNDPKQFMFYEIWASQADLEAHDQSEHIIAFRAQLDDLLAQTRVRIEWDKI